MVVLIYTKLIFNSLIIFYALLRQVRKLVLKAYRKNKSKSKIKVSQNSQTSAKVHELKEEGASQSKANGRRVKFNEVEESKEIAILSESNVQDRTNVEDS